MTGPTAVPGIPDRVCRPGPTHWHRPHLAGKWVTKAGELVIVSEHVLAAGNRRRRAVQTYGGPFPPRNHLKGFRRPGRPGA